MASKDEVIRSYRTQSGKYTHGSVGREGHTNIFYEGRILYSFGHHFPLAVRHVNADSEENEGFGCKVKYLINGDRVSKTTTGHQDQVIGGCRPNVQVPFSALMQAWNYAQGDRYSYTVKTMNQLAVELELRLEESQFKIVNYCRDEWTTRYKISDSPEEWSSWMSAQDANTYFQNLTNKTAESQNRHRLGAVLFTIRSISFLSSFDNLDKGNYFLCQVPRNPSTVDEAYEYLKPDAVKTAEQVGLPILRQGDWFFTRPYGEAQAIVLGQISKLRKTEVRGLRLGGNGGTHVVTRARQLTGIEPPTFAVAGCVTHRPQDGRRPEHKRLKLGTEGGWWIPFKNTSEAGWSAMGNVD